MFKLSTYMAQGEGNFIQAQRASGKISKEVIGTLSLDLTDKVDWIYSCSWSVTSNYSQAVDSCLLPWQLLFLLSPKPAQDPSIDLFSAGRTEYPVFFQTLVQTPFPSNAKIYWSELDWREEAQKFGSTEHNCSSSLFKTFTKTRKVFDGCQRCVIEYVPVSL